MKRYSLLFAAQMIAFAVLLNIGVAQAADAVREYTLGGSAYNAGVTTVTWAGIDGDDTGVPISVEKCRNIKSVQLGAAGGNTDGSGTYILQGSNDPAADPDHASHSSAVWFTLTDPQGNAISRTTSAKIEQVEETPLWIRPSSSGGTGGDIDVIVVCGK